MKNIPIYLAMTLILLTLVACGGGSESSQTPSTPTYNLNFASGGNGTLSGTASQTVNKGSSSSIVTAVPANGYNFVNWTEAGNEVGVNAALAVTSVSANHSYTANFVANTQTKATAILAIDITGNLPASTTISGADFTITLPANVTPAMANGVVATGIVSLSGVFAGSTLSPQVIYTAATVSAPGTLRIILANSVVAGLSQVGEVATITLQLANGVSPTAADFGVNAVSVIDATLFKTIMAMNVVVANVTLDTTLKAFSSSMLSGKTVTIDYGSTGKEPLNINANGTWTGIDSDGQPTLGTWIIDSSGRFVAVYNWSDGSGSYQTKTWTILSGSLPTFRARCVGLVNMAGEVPWTEDATLTIGSTTSAATYNISGNISAEGNALAGVTISTSGGSAISDASGNYSISGLANGSYTLTPTKTGYAFTPASLAITVSGTSVTGKNFTATDTGSITVGW